MSAQIPLITITSSDITISTEDTAFETDILLPQPGGSRQEGCQAKRRLSIIGERVTERSWKSGNCAEWEPSIPTQTYQSHCDYQSSSKHTTWRAGGARRDSGTGMEIPSGRKFELQLFKFCKVNEEAETANVGVLLWELEKMGITKQDARIQPIIEVFRRHRKTYILGEGREDVFGEDALSTVELDFHQFCKALSHSSTLISKTFMGQLVIPEFEEFCRQERNVGCNDLFPQGYVSYI